MAYGHSRPLSARPVFAWIGEYLLDLSLTNLVVMDVWRARLWIDVKAELHVGDWRGAERRLTVELSGASADV